MPQSVRQTSTLYAQLLNTGLQNKDQPLYQVIYNLINGLLNVQAINTNTTEIISGLVFTPGSIIYAGADGKLTQQNSGLFFDYTNVRVGIGTNTPSFDLHIKGNTNTFAGTALRVENIDDSASSYSVFDLVAGINAFRFYLPSNGVADQTVHMGDISTPALDLAFMTGNADRWKIKAAGHFVPGLDDTYDIGTSILRTKRNFSKEVYSIVNNLITTSTDGVIVENLQAATNAVQVQISPRARFRGNAWDTAASQTIDFTLETLPTAAATPRGDFKVGFSRNGGSVSYPLILSAGSSNGGASLQLPGAAGNLSSFRGGDGSVGVPVFGFVNSGGGSTIGFWTPAPNDIDLVCGGANQILWGTGLWRNSSALSMGWASSVDPNSTIADTLFVRLATAKIKYYTSESSETAGFVLDFSTDAIAKFRNRADSAFATVDCLDIKTENATFMHRTGIALTNNAAVNLATLTNAPTAGDPTKWIAIDDNGTTRFIPAW